MSLQFCYLCELPLKEWNTVREYAYPICRPCFYHEGPRISSALERASALKQHDFNNQDQQTSSNSRTDTAAVIKEEAVSSREESDQRVFDDVTNQRENDSSDSFLLRYDGPRAANVSLTQADMLPVHDMQPVQSRLEDTEGSALVSTASDQEAERQHFACESDSVLCLDRSFRESGLSCSARTDSYQEDAGSSAPTVGKQRCQNQQATSFYVAKIDDVAGSVSSLSTTLCDDMSSKAPDKKHESNSCVLPAWLTKGSVDSYAVPGYLPANASQERLRRCEESQSRMIPLPCDRIDHVVTSVVADATRADSPDVVYVGRVRTSDPVTSVANSCKSSGFTDDADCQNMSSSGVTDSGNVAVRRSSIRQTPRQRAVSKIVDVRSERPATRGRRRRRIIPRALSQRAESRRAKQNLKTAASANNNALASRSMSLSTVIKQDQSSLQLDRWNIFDEEIETEDYSDYSPGSFDEDIEYTIDEQTMPHRVVCPLLFLPEEKGIVVSMLHSWSTTFSEFQQNQAGSSTNAIELEATCPVCFADYVKSPETRIIVFRCGHSECQSCMEKWITTKSNTRCPICRSCTIRAKEGTVCVSF